MLKNLDYLEGLNLINVCDENQRAIAVNFLKLQESFQLAYKNTSLSPVCMALYDFVSSYSKFYNDTRILTEADSSKKNSYLSLSFFVLKAIKLASWVLAFEIPEKM